MVLIKYLNDIHTKSKTKYAYLALKALSSLKDQTRNVKRNKDREIMRQ